MRIPWRRSSLASSWRTSRSAAATSIRACPLSSCLRRARIVLIVFAARLSSRTTASRMARTSSSLALPSPRYVSPACALLRIAMSGWFSSCAIVAVSAPVRATRSACHSRLRSCCVSSSDRTRAMALAKTSPMIVSRVITSSGQVPALRSPPNDRTPATRPLTRSGMERCERSPIRLTRASSIAASGGNPFGRSANATTRPARSSPTTHGIAAFSGPRGSGSIPRTAAEHRTFNVPSGANSE